MYLLPAFTCSNKREKGEREGGLEGGEKRGRVGERERERKKEGGGGGEKRGGGGEREKERLLYVLKYVVQYLCSKHNYNNFFITSSDIHVSSYC